MPTLLKPLSEIVVGDILPVCWHPKQEPITRLESYQGRLLSVLGEGSVIATFASGRRMTISSKRLHEVIIPDLA